MELEATVQSLQAKVKRTAGVSGFDRAQAADQSTLAQLHAFVGSADITTTRAAYIKGTGERCFSRRELIDLALHGEAGWAYQML